MMLNSSIQLIPRNNWDYGADALSAALGGMMRPTARASNMERIFQQKPVWTKSGRTSLYAILKALELPPNAKVGVPLFCCSVVFNAICQAGLAPCFLDSNMEDGNLDPGELQKKHRSLAAVVAVHMFGNPCDMHAIASAAGSIPVIEDCAQSLFSTCLLYTSPSPRD